MRPQQQLTWLYAFKLEKIPSQSSTSSENTWLHRPSDYSPVFLRGTWKINFWWNSVQVHVSCHALKILRPFWYVLTARVVFPGRPLYIPTTLFCENTAWIFRTKQYSITFSQHDYFHLKAKSPMSHATSKVTFTIRILWRLLKEDEVCDHRANFLSYRSTYLILVQNGSSVSLKKTKGASLNPLCHERYSGNLEMRKEKKRKEKNKKNEETQKQKIIMYTIHTETESLWLIKTWIKTEAKPRFLFSGLY